MGYQIDVAFDMRIVGSMTNLYDMFVKKAEKNNCEMHYINYEMEEYNNLTEEIKNSHHSFDI